MAVSKLAARLGRKVLPLESTSGPISFPVEGPKLSNKAFTSVLTPRVQEPEKKREQRGAVGPYGPPPLTLLFGWAGSNDKNLAKYSKIYLNQGCTTAHMTLPTSHIFRVTEEVPEVMSEVVDQLEEVGIRERPLLVHCLSDTGIMCYQGLQLATRGKLDVRGVVWDSCPGPRPEITVPRVAALLAVNWYCARKDGLNSTDAAVSSYRLLIDRGWPNLVRRLQGKQLELSVIQGVWAGHFGRDHFQLHKEVAELFLFSNTDYYLPQKYLESEVLEKRRREGARFSATRFSGSAHVQHLRKHPAKYEAAVVDFLKRTMSTIEEEEEVEEEVTRLSSRGSKPSLRFPQLTGSFGM